MYQDLLALIQKQVSYSIFKTGDTANFISLVLLNVLKVLCSFKRKCKKFDMSSSPSGTIDLARNKLRMRKVRK